MSVPFDQTTTTSEFLSRFARKIPDGIRQIIARDRFPLSPDHHGGGSPYAVQFCQIKISPEDADWLNKSLVSVVQRDIHYNHALNLAEDMRQGNFNPNVDRFEIAILNGKVYLLGGRHRATAQHAAQKTYVHPFAIQKFNTEEEMRNYYMLTHSRKAISRTNIGDIMLSGFDVLKNSTERRLIVGAMRIIIAYDLDPTMGYRYKDDRNSAALSALAARYATEIEAVMDLVCRPRDTSPSFKTKFSSMPTALAIVCMRHNPAKAKALLDAARLDAGLEKGSAALMLHTLVLATKNMNSESSTGGRVDYQQKFCYLWEHHFFGRNVTRYHIGQCADAPVRFKRPYGVPDANGMVAEAPQDDAARSEMGKDIRQTASTLKGLKAKAAA